MSEVDRKSRQPVQLPPSLELERVLPTEQAAAFAGNYHPEWWRQMARKGEAPAPIKLSARRYGWRVKDLIAWQEAKKDTPAAA